jgi:hypothetical protein
VDDTIVLFISNDIVSAWYQDRESERYWSKKKNGCGADS